MGKYSDEKNIQILIAILKANHIRKIVVSPGTTNISLVGSLVNDGSFEMYSAVDERGAAYIACGLSSESGEPVAITCTGATASRNYFPGLTEAFHRKLPILAITASQDFIQNGNLSPQFIDRSLQPPDVVKMSVQVPIIRNNADEYQATLKINKAVLELFRHGGGPVHIDLASAYSNGFSVDDLSYVRIFQRYFYNDSFPEIAENARVAIIVGNHKQWSSKLTKKVDHFCALYNAVVLVDHSSHYWGKFRVLPTIITAQELYSSNLFQIDLLIHIGEEHGDYYTEPVLRQAKEVWRVSPDGEIRDTYAKLTNVFEMDEETFFNTYVDIRDKNKLRHDYYDAFIKEANSIYNDMPDLPFSNIWIAQQIMRKISPDAMLELGLSNTMRAFTFFDFKQETYTLSNTGCRGIDGVIPTLLGMSLANPNKLHYAVMGDLTFFYSFNVLGNRHLGTNIRILMVNNGCGAEFNVYQNRAMQIYHQDHEKINMFIAAGGHTGTKSRSLVKHYAEDLGMKYLTASSKEEFLKILPEFTDNNYREKSVILEVFTDVEKESSALKLIRNIKKDSSRVFKRTIKNILGKA